MIYSNKVQSYIRSDQACNPLTLSSKLMVSNQISWAVILVFCGLWQSSNVKDRDYQLPRE